MRDRRSIGIMLAAGFALAGCSGSPLPELPKLAMPSNGAYAETPTEIYTRIARGALSCWFGASGPLKGTHIFHADVAPPSEKAGAEIIIYTRDAEAPSPRALRAFRIAITRAPEGTFVASENMKIPEPLATGMREDVTRWAGGGAGCSGTSPEAWAAKSGEPAIVQTGSVSTVGGKSR
ncbi:MAG TPA: hypothetical protein VG966_06580 [Hyphomicrobiaceae bacterium]|nr:hypothetical protein [Hyphomicrobiaceae bacterium]